MTRFAFLRKQMCWKWLWERLQHLLILVSVVGLGTIAIPSAAIAQFAPPDVAPTPILLSELTASEAIASSRATSRSLDLAMPTASIYLASGGAMFSFSGQRPTNLGVKDGALAACPSTPNCVNSQAPADDKEHSVEPLTYTAPPAEAMSRLKDIIETMERTEIVEAEGNYLYAEFTSKLMGFVDDVEFYLDEEKGVIHVRSASRLGQSDLGVNRKRVEEIRAKLAAVG